MQENAKDQVEASLMSLFNEMQQLKDAMNAYDVPLMYRSLDLLKQALTEGQISLIINQKNVSDWFRELFSKLYQRIQLKEVQKRSKGFSL